MPPSATRPRIARVPPSRPLVASVALLVASGCGGDHLDSPPDALQPGPPVSLARDRRLGGTEGTGPAFTAIAGVDVDHEGFLYVLDAGALTIRIFDRDLQEIRSIGRRGQGPGEFQTAPRFGVVGDTVWAVESFRTRRLTLFDREGRVLFTANVQAVPVWLQPPGGLAWVMPVAMRGDGHFVSDLGGTGGSTDLRRPTLGPSDTVLVPRVVFDARGAVVDTLGWEPRLPEAGANVESIPFAGGELFLPPPPPDTPLRVPLTDGVVVVERPTARAGSTEATITLTRIGLEGDTVARALHPYAPVAYTGVVLDSIATLATRGRPDGAFAAVRGELDRYPAFQPPVQGPPPHVGADGRIWLRREDTGGANVTWTVFESDLRLAGELTLERRSFPRWSRGDTVWVAGFGEYDVPVLDRYLMRR